MSGQRPAMHREETAQGKWAIVFMKDSAQAGILWVKTFICESYKQDGSLTNWEYDLRARDLYFTSFEGWTVKLWDDTEVDRSKLRGWRENNDILDDATHEFYQGSIHPISMRTWEGLSDDERTVYAKLVIGFPFQLSGKDVMKFKARNGNNYFDYFVEKFKLTRAAEIPDENFRFMNHWSAEWKKDKEKDLKWLRGQINGRLGKLR